MLQHKAARSLDLTIVTVTDFFETAYFFIQIRLEGALNRSGERSQNKVVLVSAFVGFVWTEGRFA